MRDIVVLFSITSRHASHFLRGPRSGDELCNVNEECGDSSIGILAARVLGEENHYATTCYHVCFNKTLSEDINTAHNTLKEDYKNNSARYKSSLILVFNHAKQP
jgi:hypothetical protein